jgi:(S)-sulfolactate dehydrogenase
MPDIVISEFMDEEAVRQGLVAFDTLYDPSLVDKPDELSRALSEARALIVRNRTQVRGALLQSGPNLQAIGRLGVGLDNIDVEACRRRGIAVFPALGANDDSVAEYVIATAMVLLRNAYTSTPDVVRGSWPRTRAVGREIAGKQLGLVGFGAIAKETARRAAALGMTVAAYDPHVPADHPSWNQPWGRVTSQALPELLAASDVISLHVPLTAETRNLIGAEALETTRRDAILINAARGGVVDEGAVVAALTAGRLGGAALDVFDEEPLSAARGGTFAGCPNLILTPHIAGVTVESNERVSWATVKSVAAHLGAGRVS